MMILAVFFLFVFVFSELMMEIKEAQCFASCYGELC